MAESVKVAVRVRPFNSREKARNAKNIISMSNNQTEIKDPETGQTKKFAFDYSYWSHDSFKEDKSGYLVPESSKYSDQKVVFNDLGIGVLKNAWKGYNTSLFAYGQTGSGKSYSMVGYGVNKGIVPLSCEKLFQQIEDKRAKLKSGEDYQVTFSMLEIYNEQVRDLLSTGKAQKGGLRIREHSSKGFYVEGLITAAVNSYKDIDGKMNEGTKNRTVAATNMNASSSRAHTVVGITFTQKSNGPGGQSMTKSSTINLVDLAGSERAESTGATGDRLKEGSSINQSLSALGNCIKALADQSTGQGKVAVPFRNSALTKLLKNALGGNSKTVMIAALSPADINYEETLSTLRFADRAKAIKTKAVINENPTDKLIRELREENERLKNSLGGGKVAAGGPDAAQNAEMAELMRKNEEELESLRKTNEELMKTQQLAAPAQSAAPVQGQIDEKKKTVPHLWNLNADPALCGFIVHFLESGKIRIGTPNSTPKNDIELVGLELQKDHAVIINKKDTILIKPSKGAAVSINGKPITGENLLKHNDRILFGSSLFYVVHHPKELAKLEKKGQKVAPPTYEDAQEDIGKGSGLAKLAASAGSEPDDLLMQDLSQTLIMVHEANEISKALTKQVKFEVTLMSPQARGLRHGRTEVMVKMKELKNNHEWTWDRNKFINRKYLMQEMYQNYIEGDDWEKPQEQDPFWEPADMESCFGVVQVLLQSIGYLIDIESALPINDFQGNEIGHLQVQIVPCDQNWGAIEYDFVEDPSELVGKSLNFILKIPYARGLPKQYQSSFCSFKFFSDNPVQTNEVNKTINPNFDYEKRFSIPSVTAQLVDYLSNDFLVIELWGRQVASAEPRLATSAGGDVAAGAYDGEKARMQSELHMLRLRCGNAEFKLGKLKKLIGEAKKDKKKDLPLCDLEMAMKTNKKWVAVGKSLILMNSVKRNRQTELGSQTSAACQLQ